MVSVLMHIYYPESIPEFCKKIELIDQYVDKVYINLVRGTFHDINALNLPPGFNVTVSPNKGKDIGGKLILLSRYLLEHKSSPYLLFLHDKKSPQSPMSSFWSKSLFRITDPDLVPHIIEIFEKHKDAGMVASSTYIKDEWQKRQHSFDSASDLLLQQLVEKYNLSPPDFQFVAGTMFWVRSKLMETFFTKNDPISIVKTLESGNVMDNQQASITHSWERLLSWVCTSQHKMLYGI